MPRCQLRLPAKQAQRDASFPTPQKVGSLEAWLVAATKALRNGDDMPVSVHLGRVQRANGWTETDRNASDNFIRFDFVNSIGEKCVIIIERRFQQLGERL